MRLAGIFPVLKLMDLRDITPVVLTYNEAPNLRAVLESLKWADRIVIMDSGSQDASKDIAVSFANVSWAVRPFDNYEGQWRAAITECRSEYVLALDADMQTTPAFIQEMAALPRGVVGALVPFRYDIGGVALMAHLLKPQLRFFSKSVVQIGQDGHRHKFVVDGPLYHFKAKIIHDDRKPLDRWIASQAGYSRIECEFLRAGQHTSTSSILRRLGLMPLVAGTLSYFLAGGPLKGRASARYALERVVCECLVLLRLLANN